MNFTVEQARRIKAAYETWHVLPKSFAAFMNREIFGDDEEKFATGPTWSRWAKQAIPFLEAYEKAVQEEVERRLDEGVYFAPAGQENGDSGQSGEPNEQSDKDNEGMTGD